MDGEDGRGGEERGEGEVMEVKKDMGGIEEGREEVKEEGYEYWGDVEWKVDRLFKEVVVESVMREYGKGWGEMNV